MQVKSKQLLAALEELAAKSELLAELRCALTALFISLSHSPTLSLSLPLLLTSLSSFLPLSLSPFLPLPLRLSSHCRASVYFYGHDSL